MTKFIENVIFGNRRLVVVPLHPAHALHGLPSVSPEDRRGFRQDAAARTPLHADLRRVSGRLRRSQQGGDRDPGARRRYLHPRVLRCPGAGDRRCLLHPGRRSHPGHVALHPQRPLHRSGGGRHLGRQRHPGRLRTRRRGARQGSGEHSQIQLHGPLGGQRFHGGHHRRRVPRDRPQHRGKARLHQGRLIARGYSTRVLE